MPELFRDESKRTLVFMGASMIALALSFFTDFGWPADPAWVAVILCGTPIVWGAAKGLVTEFDVKADVLVSIALVASLVIGELFAAGEVALIMTLGGWLEERTVAKARAGIEKLVRLTPSVARVVRDGEESVVQASEVMVGDCLRVLAGETVPVDGVITAGQTAIDESVMTGEPLPVDKGPGDEVRSGTLNQFGTFDMEAKRVGEDSSIQRMVRLVESADAGKAKVVGLADRWATWIVAAALTAAAVTGFVTGEMTRAITVLLVFCPCALVLATPAAIMAGIGNAARHGILVSRGDTLERLAKVKRVAFDKTGTLTFGRPAVSEVVSYSKDISARELLELAASAEARSEHPLGKAIAEKFREETGAQPAQPEAFRMIPGRGVIATVRGAEVRIGNEAMLSESGRPVPEPHAAGIEKAKDSGATVVHVMGPAGPVGRLILTDTLRPDSAAAVRAIEEAGAGTLLITGDGQRAASAAASRAGITDVMADCLPESKLEAIRLREKAGEPVCMVGDGVNDAPALKAATVGIAMGGVGSDIAIEAADAALVGDDIMEIPHLLALSKRVMRTIAVNISASMFLNFAAIALAVAGWLSPVLGALVHNAGSVAVIINSALLLNWKGKPRPAPAVSGAPGFPEPGDPEVPGLA